MKKYVPKRKEQKNVFKFNLFYSLLPSTLAILLFAFPMIIF
uniref:Uncharacterized protein n=1 Tax=Lepeophtheirus salmonis TaxID=72036 RepID=A0A0K2TUK0_LEPSM